MLKQLLRDSSASVAIEFAACFPFLLLVYIGSYIVIDEVACNRKVSVASRTLADLLSRGLSPTTIYSNPSGTDATATLSAAAVTLTPYSTSHAKENIALVRVCDATHAYVVWSQATTFSPTGTATAVTPALTAGTLSAASVMSLSSNLVTSQMIPTSPDGSNVCTNYSPSTEETVQVGTAGAFLFVGEVDYTYQPLAGFGFPTTVSLGNIIFMSPRLT
jgi:Flp pilus assembly protein TadG